MRVREFSYRCGAEVIPAEIQTHIEQVLVELSSPVRSYGGSGIREEITTELQRLGWSNEVKLDSSSKITITGMNDHIGLCVQVGNMSRIYADLMKLQALFLRGSIKAGIIILPSHSAAKTIGKNIANNERLERELEIFNFVITMPLLVVSFSDDGGNAE